MTLQECINAIDSAKINKYTTAQKIEWLSFLEYTIINEVLKTHEGYNGEYDDFNGYTEDDMGVTLIITSPYESVYVDYLEMRIDEANGETSVYNASAAQYNAKLLEYKKWYNKTHMPLSATKSGKSHNTNNQDITLSDSDIQTISAIVYSRLLSEAGKKIEYEVDKALSDTNIYTVVTDYMVRNRDRFKGERGADGSNGKDGEPGAPFTYSDFTPEQLDDLRGNAKLAEAWAIGGTPENAENNAKYYASKAEEAMLRGEDYYNDTATQASNAARFSRNAAASEQEAKAAVTLAESYKNEAYGYKNEAESYKNEANTHSQDALRYANQAEHSAETASGYVQKAYNYTYGDDTNYPYYHNNNAKYFYEQTKAYAQGCAILETATGVNAIKIDDVSFMPAEMDVSFETSNLITMKNGATDGYELPVKHGKTYTISAKLKDGVTISNNFWGYKCTDGTNGTTDYTLFHEGTSEEEATSTFTVGENNSRDFKILTNGFTADDFEYIQLNEGKKAWRYTPYVADVSGVKVKSCGKNLINHAAKWEQVEGYWTLDIPVPYDVTISYTRNEVKKYYSLFKTNKKNAEGKWDWSQGKRENIGYLGTPAGGTQATTYNSKKITFQSGYKYKIFTSEDICYKDGEYITGSNLKWMQVEVGDDASEYEEYKTPVDGAVNIYPTTTLVADTEGVKITAEYKKDINKVIAELEQAIANL